jgi:tRNA threonylcarbamoyladenosine biosynthesis protein TsaE
LGEKLGSNLSGGAILALTGELGSGKTTWVQGLAKGLGIKKRIISPTFIIVRKYQIDKVKNLFHVDLYRLEGDLEAEGDNLGLTEIWGDSQNVVVIEWAEKIKDLLPKQTKWVKFKYWGKNERKIIIE